jgi:hypothetical protein
MEFDFADIRPDLKNFLAVGVMSVIFIIIMKYTFNRYPVAGLTELLNAI